MYPQLLQALDSLVDLSHHRVFTKIQGSNFDKEVLDYLDTRQPLDFNTLYAQLRTTESSTQAGRTRNFPIILVRKRLLELPPLKLTKYI